MDVETIRMTVAGRNLVRAVVYTRRNSLQVPVNENVDDVLADTNLPFEADVELNGRSLPVRVNFVVAGARRESALLTLSSSTTT